MKSKRSNPPSRAGGETAAALPRGRAPILIGATALLLGIAARAICVSLAPLTSYGPDHCDNMAWSAWAAEHGPTRLYDMPKLQPILTRDRNAPGRESVTVAPHACNYPPLAAMVFWFQGQAWKALDDRVATIQIPSAAAQRLGVNSVSSRVIETPAARFTQSLPSMVFDVALAIGVAALVRTLRGAKGSPAWDALAGGITFVYPPVFLDSAYWGQTDSWVATWMVWSLWALLGRRWWLAGALWGAAMMTKPQGILLAPVFAYAALARWIEPGGSPARAMDLGKTLAAALVVVGLVAAPFMMQDRGHADGPLRWFHRSYGETVGGDLYPRVTLSAFNFWWLNYTAGGASRDALDSKATLMGLSKDAIGKLMLAGTLVVAGFVGLRRRVTSQSNLVAFAFVVLLAAFSLPTRVHERYIYYGLPLLIALAVVDWRVWLWPLVALSLVGSAEMLTFRWLKVSEPGPRGFANLLALLVLASLVYAIVMLAIRTQPPPRRGSPPAAS